MGSMFEVSWCKMPKAYVVKDEKEKLKKKEKKSKKKRKKKKKRKYDSDSSEDDSDSDVKITDGKKQYEQYISDPNMDIHKRKNAILTMIEDIISDKGVSLVMVTQPKLAFNID